MSSSDQLRLTCLRTFFAGLLQLALICGVHSGYFGSGSGQSAAGACVQGLYRHPTRCDAYMECTPDGQEVERYCGPTLYYDADKQVCDYQQSVKCYSGNNAEYNSYQAPQYGAGNQIPSAGSQSYQETVYGQQSQPAQQQSLPEQYNRIPDAAYSADDVKTYCQRAVEEAKAMTHQYLIKESEQSSQDNTPPMSSPYSFVSNFLHTQPYVRSLTPSAMVTATAIQLIQNRYSVSGERAIAMLRDAGMAETLLKPLQGSYRPDSDDMPVTADYDFCPYPANIQCPPNSYYRTFDGSCNNLAHPLFGRSMTPFRRLLRPNYADGVSSIRQSVTGQPLPSPRFVSHHFFHDVDRSAESQVTMAYVFFAQFVDHDITRTGAYKVAVPGRPNEMREVQCGTDGCGKSNEHFDPCLPIPILEDDYEFAANRCLKFVRSMPVPPLDCAVGPREHLNQVTHWIDGSQIYGSTKKEADAVRDLTDPRRGRLATINNPDSYLKPLLPSNADAPVCHGRNATIQCFKAGDGRVNENTGIMTYHTVFVRQHNLIEEGLNHLNPAWDGEKLFQETRRIVAAMLQHIIFSEFLPLTLGPQLIHSYQLSLQSDGYFQGYDSKLDSRIPNEFTAAAFRFGHTLLQEKVYRVDDDGRVDHNLYLSQTFNNPMYAYDRRGSGGIDALLRGLAVEVSQKFDWFFTKQITHSLFAAITPHGVGHDLASINLQRGRDHGLPTYNDFREYCGIRRARSFEELAPEIAPKVAQELSQLYSHVDDIDLYAGGVAEESVKGGVVGPTFGCIIATAFRSLRLGDRFWYENQQAGFTPEQLQEIRKVRIARIMCLNSDYVNTISPHVFLRPSTSSYQGNEINQQNAPVPCDSLPEINLSLWKDTTY